MLQLLQRQRPERLLLGATEIPVHVGDGSEDDQEGGADPGRQDGCGQVLVHHPLHPNETAVRLLHHRYAAPATCDDDVSFPGGLGNHLVLQNLLGPWGRNHPAPTPPRILPNLPPRIPLLGAGRLPVQKWADGLGGIAEGRIRGIHHHLGYRGHHPARGILVP